MQQAFRTWIEGSPAADYWRVTGGRMPIAARSQEDSPLFLLLCSLHMHKVVKWYANRPNRVRRTVRAIRKKLFFGFPGKTENRKVKSEKWKTVFRFPARLSCPNSYHPIFLAVRCTIILPSINSIVVAIDTVQSL